MKKQVKKFRILVESRFTLAYLAIAAMTILLSMRLWYLQIYKGEHYAGMAQRNRVRRVEVPAARGSIFDRHKKVILSNKPFYDLALIPQFSRDRESTFKAVSLLLHIPMENIKKRYRYGRGVESYMPIILKRNLSIHEVSLIESNRIFLPGIEVLQSPRRNYSDDTPPHLIGYLAEIDRSSLKSMNRVLEPGEEPYRPGDLIGKQGLEKRYESLLRGKRGHRYIQVDAFGHKLKGQKDYELNLPMVEATPGHDLELTLDMELQREVNAAFKGKYGAVTMCVGTGQGACGIFEFLN